MTGGSSLCRYRPSALTWARTPFTFGSGSFGQGAGEEEEVHAEATAGVHGHLQTSLIGLEACAGADFLGRALRKQGHDVKLIPGQFVKPFAKSNKNEFVYAEVIARL